MAVITYIGIKDLEDTDVGTIKGLSKREAGKIDYLLPDAAIKFHLKVLNSGGNNATYNIKLNAVSKKGIFKVEAEDWDLNKVIHMAFSELSNLIKHKLKL
ncbi:MAG: hypothetical protein ABIB71_03555 [Candidatus Woesearchaeota archaeon]